MLDPVGVKEFGDLVDGDNVGQSFLLGLVFDCVTNEDCEFIPFLSVLVIRLDLTPPLVWSISLALKHRNEIISYP